jgi:hypothetical protein
MCPVCESAHVLIVVSARPRASCSRCGARWIQEGSEQRAVHTLESTSLNISAVSVHPTRPLNVLAGRGTR